MTGPPNQPDSRDELRARLAAIRAETDRLITAYRAQADQHMAAARDHMIAAGAAADQAGAAYAEARRILDGDSPGLAGEAERWLRDQDAAGG